ncbi:MotA/TolQ/ExbB proton channel family protein [Schlesneria paludicola]|uniref:MotA/TolQ/ExbB proton channel family protein n=1 Tax=Schlesneria paludicola TaxID=360056 RepID=UPI0003091414|nr:MotA/TolQ/ExbB proton channel family protein [Schlesneria paludicola]
MIVTQPVRLSPLYLVLMLLALSAMTLTHPLPVFAQADDAANVAQADAAQKPNTPAPQSALMWIIHTSGWIGALLLVISIYFIATIMQLFMELRAPIVMPPQLIEQCEELLAKRDFNAIYKAVKESPSELGQLIATGMVSLSSGLADAREAIDRQGEVITVDMEKRISMLAVVGTLGPLIGLLGTLKGMISSFSVIARSDAQMKASEVAGGISEALILTFEGVGLSVPAIYFFALFKNRVATLSVQSLNLADDFIRRLYLAAQKRPGPDTTA